MSNEKTIVQIINQRRYHKKSLHFMIIKQQIIELLEKPLRPVAGYS